MAPNMPPSTLACSIQAGELGAHVDSDPDTAFKIVGGGLNGDRPPGGKDFHNIGIDPGGQRRQIMIQLVHNFLRMVGQREVYAAIFCAAIRQNLRLDGIGQQHLVPFGVQCKLLHLGGKVTAGKGFAKFVEQAAISGWR